MRIVYMGTPDFAVPALRALADVPEWQVVGVFTNPDRPSGRGKKLRYSPVKQAALDLGIPVCQPRSMRKDPDALAQLVGFEPDIAVVAAYGQILPRECLDAPRLGCVNIHASLLPQLRGAAPINWAIIRGHEQTGITTMQMDVGLDTGPMLLQRALNIGPLETATQLHDRLSALGAELIVDTLRAIETGTVEPKPQDDGRATWAPMMSKADGAIDWTASADDVANLIRGTNPWPGAYSELEGQRIKFHLAEPTRGEGSPGTILHTGKELVVACGVGAVRVLQLQAPGGRPMDALDFLNGFSLSEGQAFG